MINPENQVYPNYQDLNKEKLRRVHLSPSDLQSSLPEVGDLVFLNRWFNSEDKAFQVLQPLLKPLSEFLGRPAKYARANLVTLSFQLLKGKARATDEEDRRLLVLTSLVESLHAGSLVIDDIEDRSNLRRGRPTLHSLIGEAAAMNAGNWLYFWPTYNIRRLNLPAHLELDLYRLYHQTMIRAHYGQALDLSYDMTKTPRDLSYSISMANISLKTGALTRMCAEFGALIAGADTVEQRKIAEFGESFGVALQMFNDLSDYIKPVASLEEKAPLTTPSWVWAVAAEALNDHDFIQFQNTISGQIMNSNIVSFHNHPVIITAMKQAKESMMKCISNLRDQSFDENAICSIEDVADKVIKAYA